MSDEKRKAPRFRIHQMIEIQFPKETFILSEGINLSESGLLCITEKCIEPYTKIFIMLEIPLGHETFTLKADGVVIRSEEIDGEHYTGIDFTSLFDSERLKIQEYLKGKTAAESSAD